MKNIKNFKEFAVNELFVDPNTNAQYTPDKYNSNDGSIIDEIVERGVKDLEVLIKFGSITNEEQLQSKAGEMLNLMYKLYEDPTEKEAISSNRNEILQRIIDELNEKGLIFKNEIDEEPQY
jgi:glutamine synthetase